MSTKITLKHITNFISSPDRSAMELQHLERVIGLAWRTLEENKQASFTFGDKIKFNKLASPKVLVGKTGQIAGFQNYDVIVIIDAEEEDYASKRKLKVPASIIDSISNGNH